MQTNYDLAQARTENEASAEKDSSRYRYVILED